MVKSCLPVSICVTAIPPGKIWFLSSVRIICEHFINRSYDAFILNIVSISLLSSLFLLSFDKLVRLKAIDGEAPAAPQLPPSGKTIL